MLRDMFRLLLLLLFAAVTLPATAQGVRDHERARVALERGEFVPLERILDDARSRHAGRIVDVELDDGEYEIEILRGDGVVVELEYDARTGHLLETEFDHD